ncbi:MAG: hypothetical protein RL033_500 [Pseudomonadota bacterium]
MDAHSPGGRFDEAFQLAMLEAAMGGIDAFVSCIDRQRRILFLNRTLTRDISEVLGKRIDDFITPPYRQAAVECVERAFASQTPQRLEYVVTLAEGADRHLATRVVPFRAPGGMEVALQITTDVSEPRRLAEELQQSVEFRRRVVENLPDFVTMVDRERRFVWINRTAPQLKAEDVIGAKLDAFLSPDGLDKAISAIANAFASAEVGQYETEAYRDGQTQAWYTVRVVPVLGEGTVEHVLLITTDITERKRAEQVLRDTSEQLHRAQRLDSLGQLAGGIAHDFNNLLQVIEGNLSFAKQILNEGGAPRAELEQATLATERAAELTSHLLAIGRRTRVDSKRVELGELVGNSLRMLRRTIPETVVLKYEAPATRYYVALDAPQFEQVLTNLCVNAWDAMPQGGILTIRIEPEGSTHVLMSVCDTGVGIPAENLPRIFEPFFTTKGVGSGLGLAVAAGIVAAHAGAMTAESDGKCGATLKVKLPRIANTSEQPKAKAEAAHGAGVILIAEDEELVRVQVARILVRAGYTVLQANNGVRAVEMFRAHQHEIDLVILDVVMPELNGWQAFLEMEKLQPQLGVLFTTGYAANVLPEDFAARGARLLSKPYKPERLLAQVRELIPPAKEG